MLDANMVLLLKPGKDPLDCSGYRPIAVLNVDLKILTKVLADRLAGVISSLVKIDQTGFMPGKSTDTNLRCLFTHLQLRTANTSTRIVLSVVIEKAFDSINWQYMLRVLETMGFGQVFR